MGSHPSEAPGDVELVQVCRYLCSSLSRPGALGLAHDWHGLELLDLQGIPAEDWRPWVHFGSWWQVC